MFGDPHFGQLTGSAMWVTRVTIPVPRIKSPLHHLNACDPYSIVSLPPGGWHRTPKTLQESDFCSVRSRIHVLQYPLRVYADRYIYASLTKSTFSFCLCQVALGQGLEPQ